MSVTQHDQYHEELGQFIKDNNIDLDNVIYDVVDECFVHVFEGNMEVGIDPDDTATEYIKELQYIPEKYNQHFHVSGKKFEVKNLGEDLSYVDYEVTKID